MVNASVLMQGILMLELGDFGRRGKTYQTSLCPQISIGVAPTAGTRRLAGTLQITPSNALLNEWSSYQQKYSTDLGD